MLFPLPCARSSSSKTGSETTYFSVAQLPRSRSRQRSLQKGKSAWTAESVSVLQMGRLCFTARLFLLYGLCARRVENPHKNVEQGPDVNDVFFRRRVYPSPEPAA